MDVQDSGLLESQEVEVHVELSIKFINERMAVVPSHRSA